MIQATDACARHAAAKLGQGEMKNQYFGDINDYRKYGLLRVLQSVGQHRLLVAWMLTPDDGGSDGKLRSYLEKPGTWRGHDPGLLDGLTSMLRGRAEPSVSLIERSSLLPRASFYSTEVPDAREERCTWFKGLRDAASGGDLVFFDPDNGIEAPSKPVGRKGSSKYVYWHEIKGLWDAGCSLLIYQHFPREPRAAFVERMVSAVRDRTGARSVTALGTPRVLFLLAAQRRHEARLRDALASLERCWSGQIRIL